MGCFADPRSVGKEKPPPWPWNEGRRGSSQLPIPKLTDWRNTEDGNSDCVLAAAAAAPQRCLFIQPFNTFSEMGAKKSQVGLVGRAYVPLLVEVSSCPTIPGCIERGEWPRLTFFTDIGIGTPDVVSQRVDSKSGEAEGDLFQSGACSCPCARGCRVYGF